MNKRKLLNQITGDTGTHHFYGKLEAKRPPARDGHSGVVFGDKFIVFGGDRHHMPFNDIYCLEVKKEIDSKSYMFDF